MPVPYLHTDVVFHPNWWYKNYGLTFDRGFFYDPTRRVNQEKQMRELLYERFGDLGLGCRNAARSSLARDILLLITARRTRPSEPCSKSWRVIAEIVRVRSPGRMRLHKNWIKNTFLLLLEFVLLLQSSFTLSLSLTMHFYMFI